ncbi:MAG: hypothetical protein IPH44_40090 [Myxococcales bacterium]|nr:hypothetical protein [Myxococcales bacterium]
MELIDDVLRVQESPSPPDASRDRELVLGHPLIRRSVWRSTSSGICPGGTRARVASLLSPLHRARQTGSSPHFRHRLEVIEVPRLLARSM